MSVKCHVFTIFQNLDIYIYKHSIKTTDIGLTAVIADSPTKFEIWFRKRKPGDTYTLQCASEDIKKAWTEELSNLLWKQALRNRGTFRTFLCSLERIIIEEQIIAIDDVSRFRSAPGGDVEHGHWE